MFVVICLPSIDDPLDVEHGYDLEHVLLPERGAGGRVTEQARQRAVHHPRRVALAGVHSRR